MERSLEIEIWESWEPIVRSLKLSNLIALYLSLVICFKSGQFPSMYLHTTLLYVNWLVYNFEVGVSHCSLALNNRVSSMKRETRNKRSFKYGSFVKVQIRWKNALITQFLPSWVLYSASSPRGREWGPWDNRPLFKKVLSKKLRGGPSEESLWGTLRQDTLSYPERGEAALMWVLVLR